MAIDPSNILLTDRVAVVTGAGSGIGPHSVPGSQSGNATRRPARRLRNPLAWMAEKWTNTSSPFWRLMKP